MPDTDLPGGYILAFDYGLRRIGVAVGQFTTMTASSLEVVPNGKEPDWGAIDRIVREWKPSAFVVGLPLGPEGDDTPMSQAAKKFAGRLQGRYSIPFHLQDERLSSQAAQARFVNLRAQGGARRKDVRQLDAAAAQIILENWLNSYRPDS